MRNIFIQICFGAMLFIISFNAYSKGIMVIDPNYSNNLYNAVYRGTDGEDIEKVSKLLLNGADPNFCRGESGWIDSNPLNVVMDSFYSSYIRFLFNEEIMDPRPDIIVFKELINSGADISKRPYVWDRIFLYNNNDLFDAIKDIKKINPSIDEKGKEEAVKNFMKDCNSLIEAFLEAGADPDMLGHPYPFSYEGMVEGMTDEKANEYFSNGTRAINEAIKKGIAWESQVDLLLKYTSLDEKSLEAARESNDPLMIEKINKLWEEQNK